MPPRDARRDVHADPSNVRFPDLYFPGVQTRPNGDAEGPKSIAQGLGAANGSTGTVERSENAVTRRLQDSSLVLFYQGP